MGTVKEVCPNCEATISDKKLAKCFYCGFQLQPEAVTSDKEKRLLQDLERRSKSTGSQFAKIIGIIVVIVLVIFVIRSVKKQHKEITVSNPELQTVIQNYFEAINNNTPEIAYNMFTQDYRNRRSFSWFISQIYSPEIKYHIISMSERRRFPRSVTLRVILDTRNDWTGSSERVAADIQLILENNQWKISSIRFAQ